jgi:hypothetical protein
MLFVACGFVISLVLIIYGVFATSCALDVPLIGVMLGRDHRASGQLTGHR